MISKSTKISLLFGVLLIITVAFLSMQFYIHGNRSSQLYLPGNSLNSRDRHILVHEILLDQGWISDPTINLEPYKIAHVKFSEKLIKQPIEFQRQVESVLLDWSIDSCPDLKSLEITLPNGEIKIKTK